MPDFDQEWDDIVDRLEEQQEFEWATAMNGMTVEYDSGLWWAVPANPGDPPMGYPFTRQELAQSAVVSMAFSEETDHQKAIIPGKVK